MANAAVSHSLLKMHMNIYTNKVKHYKTYQDNY